MDSKYTLLAAASLLAFTGCKQTSYERRVGRTGQVSFALLAPAQVDLTDPFTLDLTITFDGEEILEEVEVVGGAAQAPIEVPVGVMLTLEMTAELTDGVFEATLEIPPLKANSRFATTVMLTRREVMGEDRRVDAGMSQVFTDAGRDGPRADAGTVDPCPPGLIDMVNIECEPYRNELDNARSCRMPTDCDVASTYDDFGCMRLVNVGFGAPDRMGLDVLKGECATAIQGAINMGCQLAMPRCETSVNITCGGLAGQCEYIP